MIAAVNAGTINKDGATEKRTNTGSADLKNADLGCKHIRTQHKSVARLVAQHER